MGRLFLFPKRCGKSVSTDSPSFIQSLEPRLLLAAASTAANVFAQFDGTIAAAGASVSIPLNFSRSTFKFSGNNSIIGVQVIADSGGTLDPAIVQIKDAHNRTVAPIFKNANLAAKTQSLALAKFATGKYKLIVSAEHGTTGAFSVNLFLAGDANGDFQVNSADVNTIKKSLGKRAGQRGYSVAADSNLNGVIDAFDVSQATANNKDRTNERILHLFAGPRAATALCPTALP